MSTHSRNIWFLAACLFAICLTIFTLSYLVTQPSHAIPELGGDGIKNIYTYLYHCMYGEGYWFEGMNYPYGEHIVYTDAQPFLSVPFTLFKHVTPGEALRVMWLMIGLSYVLSIIYVYRILFHFEVRPLVAVLFSGLIGIFTPQLFRLQGHFALSYACIIPMLFYWSILYHELNHWRYCIYIFILGCIVAFLHPYFIAMMLVWVSSYAIGYFIFTKGQTIQKTKHVLSIITSVLCAFIMMSVVMNLTDPIKDRPKTPVNNIDANTTIVQVFTSEYSPFWQHVKNITKFTFPDWLEGYAYIGLVATGTLLLALFIALRNRYKKKAPTVDPSKKRFSPIWLFIALAALLFSMGVPFIWHMEWLLDYLSVFKQFRSLGRFSWIFYYIITIYSVVYIYGLFSRLLAARKLYTAYGLLLLSFAVWIYDMSGYVKFSRALAASAPGNYDVLFSQKEQNWLSWLSEHGHSNHDFQSILVLPFFHEGTEKLWINNPGWLMMLGAKASLQLHLPLIDVKMSRSSWSQAFKQLKIAAGPYADKPMLHELKSSKPFLLLHFECDTLDPDQKYLLTASDYIGHYSQCNIYACYPERILANDKRMQDSIRNLLPYMPAGDTCIGNGLWYVNHFDGNNATDRLFGNGALPRIAANDSIIAVIPLPPVNDAPQYEFSCWFLVGDENFRSPNMYLHFFDSAGKLITIKDASCKRTSVDNRNLWFRASLYFNLPPRCRAIKCVLVNEPNPSYKVLDELLLRPADALIISRSANEKVMVNNHLF